MPALDVLQRWMLRVITHPGGVAAGIDDAESQSELAVTTEGLANFIEPSLRQTSIERLEVYANAYHARLIECLAEEFPTVRASVGEELFANFVVTYLQQFPSRSYTLANLGRDFPKFLQQSRPERASAEPDWADFLIDVAQLERCYSEVFDGPGEEEQPPDPAKLVIPAADPAAVRVRLTASLRLMRFSFPVQEAVRAARAGQAVQVPAPQATQLAVSRREYIVRRMLLEPWQLTLLSWLQNGSTLGEALTSASQEFQGAGNELAAALQQSFAAWTAAGLIIAVEPTVHPTGT